MSTWVCSPVPYKIYTYVSKKIVEVRLYWTIVNEQTTQQSSSNMNKLMDIQRSAWACTPIPTKHLGLVMHTYNPSTGETEIGRSQWLANLPAPPAQWAPGPIKKKKKTVSKYKMDSPRKWQGWPLAYIHTQVCACTYMNTYTVIRTNKSTIF